METSFFVRKRLIPDHQFRYGTILRLALPNKRGIPRSEQIMRNMTSYVFAIIFYQIS